MKLWSLPLFAVFFAATSYSRPALAGSVPIGYIAYDVTNYSKTGVPLLAEFDVFNLTGGNSSAPDFPVLTTLSLSNTSLTVTYSGGQSKVFGSSYFSLDADGQSLDGTPLSVSAGYPGGLKGAVSATLTGSINLATINVAGGAQTLVLPNFSATFSDPGGFSDGDLALINVTTTPEPSTWLLCGTGLAGLIMLRRRSLMRLAAVASPRNFSLGLGCVILAGAARPGEAVTLSTWTSPSTGAAGSSAVNISGSGFPSGTISAGNVALVLASACGAGGTAAPVTSVTRVVGSTDRVQFLLPASLVSGTYFVSLSGTSSGGSFASTNCAEVSVTGSSPVASLSSNTVSFSSLTAGGSSTTQTVTLSNTGSSTMTVSGITLSGTGANFFPESNDCPMMLPVGAYCTITVGFSPKIPGSYTAAINVADDASTANQSVSLSGSATPAALTIDTTNATDWKINNGALSLDYNPSKQRIFGIHLAGYSDNLVDTTSSNAGIYMDNTGFGGGTATPGYVNAGTYLDWWVNVASNSANAYTYTTHYVVYPNDPGIHTYFVAVHSATDIAGSIGQVQWVYRSNLNDFNNTYSVNQDLSNPGPVIVPLPPASQNFSTDLGRAVSDATVDLHGFTLPVGFTRQFYTKYDYSQYNYLHQAHGTFGNTFGTWAYLPSNESLVGGPTKQNLVYTGNLLIIEAYSNHLDNELSLATPAGTASSRLFGPYYFHFNTFGTSYSATGSAINTPDDMYRDTLQAGASFQGQYDSESQLLATGYTPSTQRGSVSIQVSNVAALTGGTPKTAWAVLSDPGKNHELTSQGYQYWADISSSGTATINGVVPGTYRLSVYVLGQFGELRQEGVVVNANQTTTVPATTFVPENFGTETVFTIGTPDRSSHEFLHGHDPQGHDDREFFGTWNYWADFATNSGAVVYNATAGPAGAATNDLSKWNYNHWGVFDPGLFGGVYNSADDTTDGYKYAIPPYVPTLPGASGTNGVTTRPPSWTVHFASPADVGNYASGYAVLSIALACDYGSYVLNLNGTARTWSYSSSTQSDCAVRSGLSGYTQWIAFQFPASALKQAGVDNVLTLGVSQTYGVMDDALRLELSNTAAAPSVTGWNDYEFVPTSSTNGNLHANDALPNP